MDSKPPGKRETLAEFVSRIRSERRLSLKDVERASNGEISSGYVSQIENGFAANPSVRKLRALASALRVNAEEMFAAAGGEQRLEGFTESKAWELYVAYGRIESPDHRSAIDGMIDAVIRSIDAMPKKKTGRE